MKITYIHHSCFSLETEDCTLLFDYFKGDLPEFNKNNPLFVFASHHHGDHYSPQIFELFKSYQKVVYIISNDITDGLPENLINNPDGEAAQRLLLTGADESFSVESRGVALSINTLPSTDEGVAFLISLSDKIIYYAGDLNWWTWVGEETEEEYQEMTERFKAQIHKIENKHIDVAFVPLDPRQGERYYWGLQYFMEHTDTTKVFPMHFWGDYSIIDRLREEKEAKDYQQKVFTIERNNQVFMVE